MNHCRRLRTVDYESNCRRTDSAGRSSLSRPGWTDPLGRVGRAHFDKFSSPRPGTWSAASYELANGDASVIQLRAVVLGQPPVADPGDGADSAAMRYRNR